jgi:hypothetical protein
LSLGGTLITRTAVGAGNWIFVKNSIKIECGTMETNLSLVYSSFRSYSTLEEWTQTAYRWSLQKQKTYFSNPATVRCVGYHSSCWIQFRFA